MSSNCTFVQVGFYNAAGGDVLVWRPPIGWAEVGSESVWFAGRIVECWFGLSCDVVVTLGFACADAGGMAIALQGDK